MWIKEKKKKKSWRGCHNYLRCLLFIFSSENLDNIVLKQTSCSGVNLFLCCFLPDLIVHSYAMYLPPNATSENSHFFFMPCTLALLSVAQGHNKGAFRIEIFTIIIVCKTSLSTIALWWDTFQNHKYIS